MASMRAMLLEPDASWLEERRRRGNDRWDEVWNGVLHLVPAPSSFHQEFEGDLEDVLKPFARSLGLKTFHNLSVFARVDGERNYRTPDITLVAPEYVTKRGVDARAEFVIEILSPNDETREKLPFYAMCGIPEMWIVDPITRQPEIYVLRGDSYFAVVADREGNLRSARFDIELRVVPGPKLLVTTPLETRAI